MHLYRVILAVALSACSGKETGDIKNGGSTGGGAGSSGAAGESSTGGSSSSTGGTSSSAGSSGKGGTSGSSGGAESGGASGSGASGSGATNGGGAGGAGELVSCDHRQVLCKAAEPTCPEMQVASVTENLCWGPCVKIELCACASAEECPHEESYTCWGKEHCGPYVR